jgi:hypothetical protein
VDWKLGDRKFVDRKVFIIEANNRRDQCRFRFGTFETSQGVPMLLALVALDEVDFAGLEREVLLLLPLEVPWLAEAGEELVVALVELVDEVLLLSRSGVLGSAVTGIFSELAGLPRE